MIENNEERAWPCMVVFKYFWNFAGGWMLLCASLAKELNGFLADKELWSGTRVRPSCAEWSVTLLLNWLGQKQAENWARVPYLRKPCFVFFIWVFRVEGRRNEIVFRLGLYAWICRDDDGETGRAAWMFLLAGWWVELACSWGAGVLRRLVLAPLSCPAKDEETELLSPSFVTSSACSVIENSWSCGWGTVAHIRRHTSCNHLHPWLASWP